MTQFASTLYPQTNPTNPVLHELRVIDREIWGGIPLGENAAYWVELIDSDPSMSQGRDWGDLAGTVTASQRDHARRVLTRLANLSG